MPFAKPAGEQRDPLRQQRRNTKGFTSSPLFRCLQAGGTAQVNNLLQRNGVRERLADALCSELGLESKRLCELKRSEREALVRVGEEQCCC